MSPRIDSIRRGHASSLAAVLLGCQALQGTATAAEANLAAAPQVSSAKGTMYRVVNLGPGDTGVVINAKGQVAFSHVDPWDPPWRAWFYDGARLNEIPNLGGNAIRTTGVNDLGQVAGIADVPNGFIHSFVWSKQRGTIDIGTLPGYTSAWEPVINNRGEIAATADAGGNAPWPRAFRWSAASGVEDLGLLVPGPDSSAYARAINDAGIIVGNAWAGGHSYQAFAWTRAGGMVNIDTINSRRSDPVAVGAKGQVAGNLLNDPNNYGDTFYWTAATGMRELGTGSGQGSGMFAMSSGGRIAGIINHVNAFERAMTWTPEHGMRELGTLGGHRSAALAANNKGQVVGASVTSEDRYHAFAWSFKEGMTDLNKRLYRAPPGLELNSAVAISDNGSVVAGSNAGLLLLKPVCGCGDGSPAGLVAGPIMTTDTVQAGAPLYTTINFVTDDNGARYRVTWNWGDGSTDRPAVVSTNKGAGRANGQHSYAVPDIYTITARIADAKGSTVTVTRQIVVGSGGRLVGGAGSLMTSGRPNLNWPGTGGLARFGFVAPLAATAGLPSAKGGTSGRLFFSLGGREFRSNDLQLVSMQGQQAILAGTGTINGAGKYRISLAATAGIGNNDAGSLSIKLWHVDPKTSAEVVDFDSQDASGKP